MYSTRDDPGTSPADKKSCILPPNMANSPAKTQNNNSGDRKEAQGIFGNLEEDEDVEMEIDDLLGNSEDDNDTQEADETDSDDDGRSVTDMHPDIPVIYPRMLFSGHCNVETVKDGECSRNLASVDSGQLAIAP